MSESNRLYLVLEDQPFRLSLGVVVFSRLRKEGKENGVGFMGVSLSFVSALTEWWEEVSEYSFRRHFLLNGHRSHR